MTPRETEQLERIRAQSPEFYEAVVRELEAGAKSVYQAIKRAREKHQAQLLAPYQEEANR